MDEFAQLRDNLFAKAHEGGPQRIYDATVLDIDDEAYTCTISIDDLPMPFDVRLRAVVSDKSSIDVLPKVGAAVVVGMLADDDFIVLACDEITSHRITVGTTVFTINADGTLIKRGNETLNKILTDMVNGMLTIAAPKDVPGITALLTRINTLLK